MLSKFWLESGSKDGRTGLVADLRRCRGLVLVGPLSGGAAGAGVRYHLLSAPHIPDPVGRGRDVPAR